MDLILVRRWWLAPIAATVGILVGLLLSLVAGGDRRAEASVLVSSPDGPAAVTPQLANLRELATSSVLAGNVRGTLRLEESSEDVRRHLDASVRPRAQVIVLEATDADAEKARQLAQEAAVVFTQLVAARFGDRTPPLQAAVFDSAHVLSATDRHFLRNMIVGGALGLLLGAVAAFLLRGEREVESGEPAASAAMTRDLRRREAAHEKRVDILSRRERELAKRAGQVAARERDLEKRERKLEERPAPAPAPAPPAEEKEPVSAPEPEPSPVVLAGRSDGWNLHELQRAVDAQRQAAPEQVEEWRTYLFFLREHAASDGSLPRQFDSLIEDVFGELVQRSAE